MRVPAASALLLVVGCVRGEPALDPPPDVGVDDVVTSRRATKLTFEVDAVLGREAATGALEQVAEDLTALTTTGHLDKPDGVQFLLDEELPPLGDAERAWTFAELNGLADAHRTLRRPAEEAVLHVLYVDGRYEDDDDESAVLGFAWKGDSIVMLKDNIDRACREGPAVTLLAPALAETVCRRTEATVLLHEVGHLMGLVNNGAEMVADHQDDEHGAHDVNEDCIMYWLNERSTVVDAIAEQVGGDGADRATFDEACLADLKAVVDASG
jgi:hypothetical protein